MELKGHTSNKSAQYSAAAVDDGRGGSSHRWRGVRRMQNLGGVDMDEITTSYKGFSIRRTKIEDDLHVFVVHVASDDVKRSQTIGKVIVVSPNNYEEAITLAKRCVDGKAGNLFDN